MTDSITIIKPDDWHAHLRDNDYLKTTVPHLAKQFSRAIVMPNLVPPVTNLNEAKSYFDRIQTHIPAEANFQPLMTLYLTDNTTSEIITKAKESGIVHAVKLYPAGATTNSDSGVTQIDNCFPVFETMQELGMPLLIHGEVTDSDIDIFDREKIFIEKTLSRITKAFPQLKVVFEHATTKDAVQFVTESSDFIAATITAHHLLLNRNDLLVGGIKPHHYCLPILKRRQHQEALIQFATSGSKKVFLGTDSAPHSRDAKESCCGSAGCYTAFAAIELYATVFDKANALHQLEAFASLNGPAFYGLPVNKETITIERREQIIPEAFDYGEEKLRPFAAGEVVPWMVV